MTLQEIQALTDEEIRVRVAELTGDWKNCRIIRGQHGDWDDVVGFGTFDDGTLADSEDPVPNYPADLNACAEAVNSIPDDGSREKYLWALKRIIMRTSDTQGADEFQVHTAPARARCEAFLAVMQP